MLATRTVGTKGAKRATREAPSGAALTLCVLGTLTISFNATRVAGFAVSDLLFALAAITISLKIILNQTRDLAPVTARRSSRLVMVGILMLLTFGTLSSLFAPSPAVSMLVMARFAWVTIVWFWTLRAVCRDRSDLSRLMVALRIGLVLSAIVATLGSFGLPLFETVNNENRQAAYTFHPNELMGFLNLGIQVAVASAVVLPATARSKKTTRQSIIVAGLLSYALFTTGSTSGLFATAAGLVAMACVATAARLLAGSGERTRRTAPGRSPLTIMFGVMVAIVGVVLLFSSNLPGSERLGKLFGDDPGVASSVGARDDANDEILGDLDAYLVVGLGPNLQRSPIPGADSTVINVHGDTQNGVHNMWLKLIYEEGLPALLGLWLILAAVVRQSYRLVLNTRGTDLHPLAIGLFGGLIAANVSSMFQPVAFSRHFWLPIALIGCLWGVRRWELRSEHEASDQESAVAAPGRLRRTAGAFALTGSAPSPVPPAR